MLPSLFFSSSHSSATGRSLIRTNCPEYGLIYPVSFIGRPSAPIASRSVGFVASIYFSVPINQRRLFSSENLRSWGRIAPAMGVYFANTRSVSAWLFTPAMSSRNWSLIFARLSNCCPYKRDCASSASRMSLIPASSICWRVRSSCNCCCCNAAPWA